MPPGFTLCAFSPASYRLPVYLAPADRGFDATRLTEVKALEAQGVKSAEGGDLQAALHHFSGAILILPERPSAYNNRAQALRLQGDTAGKTTSPTTPNNTGTDRRMNGRTVRRTTRRSQMN